MMSCLSKNSGNGSRNSSRKECLPVKKKVVWKAEKNVVIISAERYNELEKAERNAAFLGKLERGLAQVRAGQGIVKTMDELEAMAEDGV